MTIRAILILLAAGAALGIAGCDDGGDGLLVVSAAGGAPRLLNPNLDPVDPASAFLLDAVAQGLVRFDAGGQVEPALAQSWIVSDDGLRYTFRLARAEWADGGRVTAAQVVERLRAAGSRASRNPVKPLLGAIDEIVAMTDEVLEISLKAPRPNFLQLLAQPEMTIARGGKGTGPFAITSAAAGALTLSMPAEDNEDQERRAVLLRGERTALGVARFQAGAADFVTGGTANDLPVARAAGIQPAFDPVNGLFGLMFVAAKGPLADPAVRRALDMAVDRDALVGALGAPDPRPRASLLPTGIDELPDPAQPDWAAAPLAARRAAALSVLAAHAGLRLRIAVPEGPGYTLLFAHIRRDWRSVGVDADRVTADAAAELRLVDEVAPTNIATWYLRHFVCETNPLCLAEIEPVMAAARAAGIAAERRAFLAQADRAMSDAALFIPIAAPVRWSLVSRRVPGFRPNAFARHPAVELVAEE